MGVFPVRKMAFSEPDKPEGDLVGVEKPIERLAEHQSPGVHFDEIAILEVK
jgi:hypothetical protein